MNIKELKNRIRTRIWDLMESLGIAEFPRPVHGRIPNFKGADVAALRLATLREWASARVIKANPDSPQQHVRFRALIDGKILIMASPRLRSGFIILDPSRIPSSRLRTASTISGAFKYGRLVKLSELPAIDLIITGCVAVDRRGVRLGKGGGYSELEYGILRELGLVDDETLIATTIHDVQLIDDEIPLEIHDYTVDLLATPTRIIQMPLTHRYRPSGIYWELLKPEIRELNVIKELAEIKKK